MTPRISADGPTRRYLPVLLSVIALIIFNQFIVQPTLVRLTLDAPAINLAGRQRMLSQKLAKTALAIDAAQTAAERESRRRELHTAIATWEQAHARLQRGENGLVLSGGNSEPIAAAFAELDKQFRPMRDAASQIDALLAERDISRRDAAAIHERVSTIILHEERFLRQMDAIVGLFESAARAHVDVLRRTGWISMAGIAILLSAVIVARQRAAERTRRLAEQLAHASRLNTMGEMATGLAHEINQPLGAIANYAEGCLARLDRGEADPVELRGALERISKAALRAGEILRRIHGFVRRQEHQCARVDIGPLIVDVENFCRSESEQQGIVVELDLAGKLPDAWADAIQIQQVLINLLRNGFQALQAQPAGERRLSVQTSLNGVHEIEVAVTDNGEGFEPRDAESLFEPFYTTRADGLGMGLAISRSIVEQHGGRLWAESRSGKGATFRFTLPPAPSGGPHAD